VVAGAPVQVVHDDVECEIEEARVSEDEIDRAIDAFVKPFDLGHAPLLRFKILIREDDRFTILSDIHHIICDGASREVLARDLISLYGGQTLQPFEITYKDYVVWQTELNRSGALRAQEKYWLDLLAGGSPPLNLPTDFERPATFSFKGSTLRSSLGEQAAERFRKLAASHGATLFMASLAVFSVVLQQRTRRPDIVLGVSVNGRHHPALRPLIGMFVNELVVWNRPRGEMRFSDFLSDVRRQSLQALANSDVQFDHLVERLNPDRDMSRNPLFTVCLSMSQALPRTIDPAGIRFTRRRTAPHFSKFDLTLFVCEDGDQIHFDFEYCTDLFRPATIADLAQQLAAVIDRVCNDPQIRLDEICLVETPRHRTRSISKSFDDRGVHELIEEQCRKRPQAIAVYDGPGQVSYRELDERANQVAHYLRDQRQIQAGEPVALLLDNSIELVIAVLGTLKAGAYYIPIDPSFPEDRVRLILNDTGARTVLSQRSMLRLLNRLQWECAQFEAYCCLDSKQIGSEVESSANALMNEELWNYVASIAKDDITGGGWTRSDTGLPFTAAEMAEYVENALQEIAPLLRPDLRVLEIGCASGLTLFRVAPLVGSYHATDFSPIMVEKTWRKVQVAGLQNVQVECLPAHAIDQLGAEQFDLIILNSVVQSFPGHNYLRTVLAKAIVLLKDNGHVFLGDLMDLDRKAALIEWLEDFACTNDNGAGAKLDWSAELFVSAAFIDDLTFDFPEIAHVEISDKWRTIENELTRFRFDSLITIDRRSRSISETTRRKWQNDLRIVDQCPATPVSTAISAADVAYVTYTSGTTGNPKGVVVEHQSLVNYVTWAAKQYEIGPDSIFPLCTPISFDLTLTALFVPLIAGGSIRIHEAGNAVLSMSQALSDNQITAIKLTPSHLDLLSVADIPADSRLRTFVVGGEDLKAAGARRIEEYFSSEAMIFNEYGPTEATVGCMVHRFDRQRDCYTSVPIGEAIENVDVYILDERQRPVADGTAGELYISGAAVARGYLKRPVETARAFLPDPFKPGQRMYRTGDLAWRRPNEVIEFLGRIDHQLKIHGHRIELREIEACILTHPDVSKAAVVVVKENGARSKQLIAYFVARRDLNDEDLRSFLKRRLPEYMLPRRCIQTADLQFNENGKLDRQRLSAITPAPESELIRPRTSLERRLARIWSEVLAVDIERIGLDSNFFALGGHSLSAVMLVSRVRSELQLQAGLADVFSFPELGEFALKASDAGDALAGRETIGRVELREYYPASYSQQLIYRKHARQPGKYNRDPIVYEARGRLDFERFRNALQELMKRHEVLRTSFQEVHGQIVQRIHEDLEVPLEMNEPPAAGRLDDLLLQERPFQLEDPPLWRVHVISIDSEVHYLQFDLHHILYDAESITFLLDDFSRLYCGEKLPPLKIQYKDYAVWEQSKARPNAESPEAVRYTHLPSMTDPPGLKGHAILNALLEPRAETALRRLSRQFNCTRLSILLAAFFQIINRETRAGEVAIGLRVSTRRHHELQKTVGPFLTKIPVQARVMENEPLGSLAQRLQETLFSVLDQGNSGVAVHSSPFPILVNYQTVNEVRGNMFGPGVTVTPFRQETLPANAIVPYEFVLAVFDQSDRVELRALYDQALYSRHFVCRILDDIGNAVSHFDCNIPFKLSATSTLATGPINTPGTTRRTESVLPV
jgi:amino acid adenylation domain-containing protein